MVRLFTLDSNINDRKLLVLHHEARGKLNRVPSDHMHRNRPEPSDPERWTPRSPFSLLASMREDGTPRSSSSALTLRYTGSGRRLFPKLPRVEAKHDALATASPGKPTLTEIAKNAGRRRFPRSSCRSDSHASSNAVAVDELVFQRGCDMRNHQECKRQHQPAVQRAIPGRLPTHLSFGNNLTRVAVWTRHPPDASGLVSHRSGEGHETYLFAITECA